jgi:hypothetical protein
MAKSGGSFFEKFVIILFFLIGLTLVIFVIGGQIK